MNRIGPRPAKPDTDHFRLPIEIEVFINDDGSVTFADLESGSISMARSLNPDVPLPCDPNPSTTELHDQERV